jgi:hypothetical protein
LTFSTFRDQWARPTDCWNDILTGVGAIGRVMQQLESQVDLDNTPRLAKGFETCRGRN